MTESISTYTEKNASPLKGSPWLLTFTSQTSSPRDWFTWTYKDVVHFPFLFYQIDIEIYQKSPTRNNFLKFSCFFLKASSPDWLLRQRKHHLLLQGCITVQCWILLITSTLFFRNGVNKWYCITVKPSFNELRYNKQPDTAICHLTSKDTDSVIFLLNIGYLDCAFCKLFRPGLHSCN